MGDKTRLQVVVDDERAMREVLRGFLRAQGYDVDDANSQHEAIERIDPTDLLLRMAAARRLSLRELEDRYLDEVLALTGGNKVQAAKILRIDRKTLYRRQERNQEVRNQQTGDHQVREAS